MKAMRIVLMAAICMFFGLTQVQAQDFSADMISRDGNETFNAKIYVSGQKSRTESADSIIITRMDRNISYMVMPTEKMYMEHPIDPRMAPRASSAFEGETARQSLGTEVI